MLPPPPTHPHPSLRPLAREEGHPPGGAIPQQAPPGFTGWPYRGDRTQGTGGRGGVGIYSVSSLLSHCRGGRQRTCGSAPPRCAPRMCCRCHCPIRGSMAIETPPAVLAVRESLAAPRARRSESQRCVIRVRTQVELASPRRVAGRASPFEQNALFHLLQARTSAARRRMAAGPCSPEALGPSEARPIVVGRGARTTGPMTLPLSLCLLARRALVLFDVALREETARFHALVLCQRRLQRELAVARSRNVFEPVPVNDLLRERTGERDVGGELLGELVCERLRHSIALLDGGHLAEVTDHALDVKLDRLA